MHCENQTNASVVNVTWNLKLYSFFVHKCATMKESLVLSCLVVSLQILFFTLETSAIPASTPSTPTTTQAPENTTKKYVNRTVLLAASSLPKSSALKKLGTGENETNLTEKFSNDGEQPVQKIGSVNATTDRQNGTEVGKEVAVEDVKPTKLMASTPAPMPDDDRKVRQAWGGNCTAAIWNVCNKIKWWGGNYVVPDKKNPGEFLVKSYKIQCVEKPDKTFCLRNGWTVARCHMLCMSQCNVEYRQNYDKLVSHEGECRMPIFRKR